MVEIHVDASELRALGESFDDIPKDAVKEMRAVIQKGALNIKTDWARRWSGLSHAPALPRAISYDTKASSTVIEAEIGPDKQRPQGALGNLLEFGSVNNAPRPGGLPAAAAEEPKLIEFAERVAAELLEKHL